MTLRGTSSDHRSPPRPSPAAFCCATRRRQQKKSNPQQTQHSRRWRKRPVNKGGATPATSDTLHRLPAADGPRSFHPLSDTHVHAPTHNICYFNPSWACERSKTMELCPEADFLIHFHESDTSIKLKQTGKKTLEMP